MRILLKKFGSILTSRPSGKEAYLAAKAYSLPKVATEKIEIEVDFAGVEVLTPSWADEFITPLLVDFEDMVTILPCTNASVKATLEIILKK